MKEKSYMSIFSRLLMFLFCVICFSVNILNPIALRSDPAMSCGVAVTASTNSYIDKSKVLTSVKLPNIKSFFKNLFNHNNEQKSSAEPVYVYLGGYPLGFTMNCEGVVVVAISNASATEIKEGDVITHIEDISVNSIDEIYSVINSEAFAGKVLDIKLIRNNELLYATIKPIFDTARGAYKLGLWVRDNAAGVGTLTYIRKDNLRFGALGHPVCDIDTGTTLPISKGNIFKCNIVGYKTGLKGNPGELKGLFLRSGSVLGTLDTNNKFGVYGTFSEKALENYSNELVPVASQQEVRSGKATIRSTIEGGEPKEYEIEIVKTYVQKTKENKSMFIRVTDKELLAKTGGIVQGMSGSPIIQDGKLVGAITHVFVSDPSKGYGVYAEWMLDN